MTRFAFWKPTTGSTLLLNPLWMGLFGAMMALGAAGYGLWMLPWVALIVPFAWVERQSVKSTVFWGGFGFGFAYFGLFCLWFFDIHPLTWFGFSLLGSLLVAFSGWLLLALEGGLLCGVLFLLYQTLRGFEIPRVFLFPLLWLFGFSLLNLTPLALPWPLVEYTQAVVAPMRWLAGWISGAGVAYLLILHNTLWAYFAKRLIDAQKGNRLGFRPLVSVSLLTLILPMVLWLLNLVDYQSFDALVWRFPVAIIQANLPIEVIRSGRLSAQVVEPAYLNPLREAKLPSGTLVAYPEEGAVPGWVSMQTPEANPFFKQLQAISRAKKVYATVGVSVWDELSGKHYNALALLSPDGLPVQFYAKRRLVPFGEYTPYGWGAGLSGLLRVFNIAYTDAFESGQTAPLLNAGAMRIGGLVCFELIDSSPWGGGYAAQYKNAGANLLVNASNLGWFHQNPLLEAQFLAIGQMRAAETRLPLVIASNTGISAILAPGGHILKMTDPHRLSQHKTQLLFYNGKE